MTKIKLLFIVSFACVWFAAKGAHAADPSADIYSIQYSADGKYVVTGGAAGDGLSADHKFTGGIKIWTASTGKLVKAFGQHVKLRSIFGTRYGRVGKRDWGIRSFKDIVLNGSYPDGKIILLPSSLGPPRRIELGSKPPAPGNCGKNPYTFNYIGPVVPSENGKFAAVVVNVCKPVRSDDGSNKIMGYRYDSSLDVVNLSTLKTVKTFKSIDAGVYALGISNNGRRVAFVGSERFAVIDVSTGKRHVVETYNDPFFQIPRQFSMLNFSPDGKELVSLRYVYHIDSGKETSLPWKNKDIEKADPSYVKIAPNLSYFVVIIPKPTAVVFGDDGLPHAYGKADRIVLLNAHTGKETRLHITKNLEDGKRCVAAISPDSKHVAVACMGGLIKVFDARTGKVVWHKQNVGYNQQESDSKFIQASTDTGLPTPLPEMLADAGFGGR
ncbi:MAG: WD40 repeat domain-containing protein [Gammaproteobacteria bacterium]